MGTEEHADSSLRMWGMVFLLVAVVIGLLLVWAGLSVLQWLAPHAALVDWPSFAAGFAVCTAVVTVMFWRKP